ENEEDAFSRQEIAEAASWAATLLADQGLVSEAETLLRQALRIWERISGFDNPSIAGALFYLAIWNARLEQFVEAESYALRALTMTARQLGKNHPKVLVCLQALANIY